MYYYHPYYQYPRAPMRPFRQYPDVDIHQLEVSVHKFQRLMRQADLLVNKLADDPQFAYALMHAAQESNEAKVNALVKSTGITIKVSTTFTPTGIRIILDNSGLEGDCCQLLIALKW